MINGSAGFDMIDAGDTTGIDVVYNDDSDQTAPTVTASLEPNVASVGVGEVLTVDYTCTDSSEIEYCSGPVVSGGQVDTSIAGTFDVNIVGRDFPGNETVTTLTYTVIDDAAAPIAVDDEVSLVEGESVSVDVLENDNDPNDNLDDTTLTIVAPPTLGSAAVVVDGGSTEIEYSAGPQARTR